MKGRAGQGGKETFSGRGAAAVGRLANCGSLRYIQKGIPGVGTEELWGAVGQVSPPRRGGCTGGWGEGKEGRPRLLDVAQIHEEGV